MSTNGSGSVYQMNNALEGYMLGDSFSAVSDDASFWDYIQSTLVPAVFPDNATAPDGYLLNYNRMIGELIVFFFSYTFSKGAIRFRQFRVKPNSCTIRGLYKSESSTCFSPTFSAYTSDKSPYGPDNQY